MATAVELGLRKQWYSCSIASLYRANFIERYSLNALQAIAILAVTRDAWSQEMVIKLVQISLNICRDMGLYRLESDQAWESSMKNATMDVRSKSLILRETKKRVFWGLVREVSLTIPFTSLKG